MSPEDPDVLCRLGEAAQASIERGLPGDEGDSHPEPRGPGESSVGRDEGGAEAAGRRHVERVAEGDVLTKAPRVLEKRREREATDRRVGQQAEGRADELVPDVATSGEPAERREHLGVDVRRGRRNGPAESVPGPFPCRGPQEELDEGRGVNDDR